MTAVSLLESAPIDEAAVLRRARRNDRHAYGLLYERHLAGARRVAASLVRQPSDVDDVVAEAFASAFAAMRRGRGPVDVFGPYIHSCVRNECRRSWSRERGRIRTQGDDEVVEAHGVRRDGRPDEFSGLEENDVVRAALDAMPARLRSVLWYTEVDDLSHATIAKMTGSTPQAVAALAMRARRAFAERYLQAHMASDGADVPTAECEKVRSGLAEVVRGTASARRCRATSLHLAECSSCAAAQGNLALVNERLRTVPLFALVTGRGLAMLQLGARARFLAWLSGPAVQVAAAGALALVVALAPAATAPRAGAPTSTVIDQSVPTGSELGAPTPIVVDSDGARAGESGVATLEATVASAIAGAAAGVAAPGSANASDEQRAGRREDVVTSPVPGPMTPAAVAIALAEGTAGQPGLTTSLVEVPPILDAVAAAVVQAVIGAAVLPVVPLPPVALPEVTVAAELTPGVAAAAIDVAVPLPPVPPALESLSPIAVDTSDLSASAGGSVNSGSGSGTGSVGDDLDVSVGGGSGGGSVGGIGDVDPPIVGDVDPPIVGDVDPPIVGDVDPPIIGADVVDLDVGAGGSGGGLLPGG